MKNSIVIAFGLLAAAQSWAADCRVSFAPRDEFVRTKQQELKLSVELKDRLMKIAAELRKPDHEAKIAEVELEIKKLEPLYDTPLCNANSAAVKKYLLQMEQKIEDCGTANLPKVGGKPVYGNGEVKFVFDVNGKVLESSLLRASDNPILDQHIINSIQSAAPFGKVPKDLRLEKVRGFLYMTEFDYAKDISEKKPKKGKKAFKCKFGA